MLAPTQTLNRKQRRAMEKQKRKQADKKPIFAPRTNPTQKQALTAAIAALKMHKPRREELIFNTKTPPSTPEEIAQIRADGEKYLQNLVHQRDIAESIIFFEDMVRNAKIFTEFLSVLPNKEYRASLLDTVAQCEEILKDDSKPLDASADQLYYYYEPLEWLVDDMANWAKVLSQHSQDIIGYYSHAIHICAYVLLLYKTPAITVAAIKIINGANSRELAKELNMKESDFRVAVLKVARYFYKIGATQASCKNMKAANSIPEMRTKEYRYIADLDKIGRLLGKAFEAATDFFEEYGIDLLNIKDYQAQVLGYQRSMKNMQNEN